jgi:hypothetical protein
MVNWLTGQEKMSKIIITNCDVCGKEVETGINPQEMQVIFTTNQSDGLPCLPYLHNKRIDICSVCLSLRLTGNSIFAHGAQGNTKFYFNGLNMREGDQ